MRMGVRDVRTVKVDPVNCEAINLPAKSAKFHTGQKVMVECQQSINDGEVVSSKGSYYGGFRYIIKLTSPYAQRFAVDEESVWAIEPCSSCHK